jgi:hypothetical protein
LFAIRQLERGKRCGPGTSQFRVIANPFDVVSRDVSAQKSNQPTVDRAFTPPDLDSRFGDQRGGQDLTYGLNETIERPKRQAVFLLDAPPCGKHAENEKRSDYQALPTKSGNFPKHFLNIAWEVIDITGKSQFGNIVV